MPPTPQVEVSQLSPKQLRRQLKGYGIETGPILPTTRPIYEKKLLECLTGQAPESPNRYDPVDDDDDDDEVVIPAHEGPTRTSNPPVIHAEEPAKQLLGPSTCPAEETHAPVSEDLGAGSPVLEAKAPVAGGYGHIYGTLEEGSHASPCSRYSVCAPVRRRPLHQTPTRSGYTSSDSPSPKKTESEELEERGLPLAVKVCILVLVLFIGYLVYINLEPSTSSRIPGKVVSNV